MNCTIASLLRERQRSKLGLWSVLALLLAAVPLKADIPSHAQADALLAEAARLAPAAGEVVTILAAISPAEYSTKGSWSPAIPWTPHIPASAALLPDGRLLTFASNQRTTFPDGPQFTYAAVWDPATGQFTEINNGRHDMFCGGLSFLQDGRLLVNGGNGINGTTALASLFDWRTNEWVPAQTMADGRWYNTSIALPNGEVLTAGGNGGSNGSGTIEQWNASSGWRRMSGIAWQAVANPPINNAIETNWHPFFLVAPDGRVAHFGPHQALDWITATGTGVMAPAGASIPGTHYPKQGAWAMYAPGKVIVAGGLQAIDDGTVVSKAFTVDLNGTTPTVTAAMPMANARSFANSVVLPNGEVMIVGGNTSGQFFSDLGTVYAPEIWNPTTGQWRAVADMTVPRNYHSLAMLLPDGRVWSGGGGLSGEAITDHQDAQVFTPPQLFKSDGTPAVRPVITAAPDRIGPASIFTVNASSGVQYFSAISISAQTHSVDTGLRHVRFTHTNPSAGVYAVTAPPSINVLTPGYWMMFAVDANGVWSVSRIIQVTNSTLPVVTNPGQQSVGQGSLVSLPISASATGGTLSYSATGLPTGLGIDATSGLISGTITSTPGTYRSTILVSAAGQVTSVSFNWIVVLPNLGSGQIMREYWTNITGTTVASLTGNSVFPANPHGRDLLASFEAPSDWDDNTGQRLRGFLHVPVTGQYRLYISSDDESSLRLSTDANPANALEVSSQPGWTPPLTWTWYAQQTSALITLQAGKRYYIEALMKEDTGDDHLAVGWKKPGDTAVSVIAGTYLSPYLPIDNPLAAWSFDEAAWKGAAGEVKSTAAALFDFPGSAVGGAATTLTNPALSGNPGTGSSALFNGASQSVVVPYSTSLNPNDFTIAAWVRSDAVPGTARCILASRDDSLVTKKGYGLWLTADGFWQLRTGADLLGLKGGAVTVGQWTHVAATFRTTSAVGSLLTGIRRLYINGSLVAEDTSTYVPNTSRPLVIGAADSPGTAFFAGAVDEVALHQAPLSQQDILALRDLRHTTPVQDQSPQITNPGAQASLIAAVVSLPIAAIDPENEPVTFSATGLPTGLSISAASGVISGAVTSAGTFNVVIQASDGISTPATAAFIWNVTPGLTLQPLAAAPQATGGALAFSAQSANGINPRYKWNFGDGTPETAWLTTASIAHTYAGPGRYLVTLTATDDTGILVTSTFYQAVYAALTTRKPGASSSIVYEDPATGNDRVWCVNPDNNSVSAFDAVTRARYAEITVGAAPRSLALAPDGRLWVVNLEAGTISIINTTSRTVAATVTLAYGSRPFGIVFDPEGTAAWVALEGTGRVLKLNPSTGAQLASVDAGGPVRHLSISADGTRVYASRFITPRVAGESTATPMLTGSGGQVVVIGTTALAVERTILLNPSTAADTSTSARGLPNYLGAAVISPDGLSAWVPSKQDNIQRGTLRDGLPMNHENSVRAIVSRLDLAAQAEVLTSRVDIDNAGMPSAAAYDPYGIYVFTALEASREVAILDAWSHQEIIRFQAGRAPQGLVISPDGGTLYVQNFMDRSISVHDVRGILQGSGVAPVTAGTLSAITTEKLTAQVLKGKQFFYDAQDPRLALQQYISCAVCHNDAGHDGRVWDMTGFGEGLRNTITLKGHATHGILHWTGNFDEVQDFEGQIRALAGGTGLMTDTQLNIGTRNQPLGDPKAGVSTDLDALAAYVKSLTLSGTSPSRTSSGALSTAATAGQQVFRAQNCASCHSGVNFTSSALNVFADVGTLKPSSGKRLGAALTGLDVPTLRGSWATGPYLHDGSAATLSDAITAHQGVTLSVTDLANLTAFVASIDDAPTTAPLPFTATLAAAATTVTAPFNVTVAFSSTATGFTLSDVVVANGVASTFSGSGASYTFKVTPTTNGLVTVSVPVNAATDSTSLGNSVSNLLSVSYTDTTPPTVALTTPATSVVAPFVVTATFSESVTGLLASEFAVTNGSVTALSSAGMIYSATVTPTAAGAVIVSLPAGMVQDAGGNANTVSNALTVTYAPIIVGQTVKIQAEDFDEGGEGVAYHDEDAFNLGEYVSGLHYRANTGVDIEPSLDTDATPSIGWITSGEWLRYTTALTAGTYAINVRMSTPFDGPVPVRVLINGTLATTINLTNSGSFYTWKTYSVTGVNVPTSGPAVVRIEFPDGNANFNWVEFVNTTTPPDTTPPTAVLATSATTVSAPFIVSAAFSEAVTGVALSDFTVTNGVASVLTGSGTTYGVTITPTANGTVTVSLPAGAAADAASNASLVSNTLSVNYTAPLPAPTVLLSSASSSVSGAFAVNAVFSLPVTGVALNDFIVTNGVASGLSGSGATYGILVTPTAAGAVTVSVPINAAINATGVANAASNLLTAIYTPPDITSPTVILTTTSASVSAPFVVTATFSEVVTDVALNDFVVTNGVASTLSGSGTTYTVTITPAVDGPVTVATLIGAAFDAANNVSFASNTLGLTYTAPVVPAPTVLLSTASSSVSGSFTVSAAFSQAVTDVALNDFIITNGVASALTGSGATYSILVTPTAPGAVTTSVPASAAVNATGVANAASNLLAATYTPPDLTPPTVALTTLANAVTAPFVVTATFSEVVSDVVLNDFTLTNGVASALSGSGTTYSVTITPAANGLVTVAMPAGAAADAASNASLVSNTLSVTYTAPLPAPSVLLSTTSSSVFGPFAVNAVFSQSVTDVVLNDFIITNGVASALTGSGATYSILVTPTSAGAVAVSVPASAAINATGGGNTASNLLTATYTPPDTTPPTVVLTAPASSVSTPFVVTSTFSETVTGIALNDFTVTNGVASALTGSGAIYTVTVTPTASGAVTVKMPAAAAVDAASNASIASNTLSVTYTPLDTTPPTVALTAPSSSVSAPFVVTATFSETVTGVALNDFTVTNGVASAFTGSGAIYTVTITPTASGAVTVKMPAAAAVDAASNASIASTTLSVTYTPLDATPPTVALTTPSTSVTAPFVVTSTFSETVTGVALNDFTVTNGVASALTGSGTIYTVTVIPTASGAVTVKMPVGAAFDAASNASLASNTLSVTYTAPLPAPTVLLSTASASVTAPFTVNAVFSQSVTGVALNDFTLTNGVASTLTGSGTTYSIRVTPTAAGAVLVRVPASAAINANGVANTTSNLLTTTYTPPDTTPPTVILTTAASSVTVPFVVTSTFSESVTGLLASEYTVTNGTVTALSSTGVIWSVTVTPTAAGNVTVRLPAGVAQDAAGNLSLVSNLLTVSYTPPAAARGLTGDYYIGKNFEQFSFTRAETTLNYTWGTGSPDARIPADGFSVRWHGYLIPRYTQTYTLIPVTDDGVRLWVNGQLVVNDWNNHGDTWNNGVIALQAGVAVSVVMEYYESTGGATARMLWESPGQTREVIPLSQWLVNAPVTAPASSQTTVTLAAGVPTTISLTDAHAATTHSDDDGASDLLELALGTPTTSGITHSGEGLQLIAHNSTSIDATLLRPSAQSGLTFTLESSSDLINWTPLVVVPVIENQGNGWERVTWSSLHALTGQSIARGIIRLRITQGSGGSTTSAPLGWQQTSLNTGTQSFGLNLINDALFTGSITAATATSVTLSEQAELASAMDPAQPYYLEIISGPQAGHRLDLLSLTGTECIIAADSPGTTLTASAMAALSGARVSLRPHRTLGTVFDPARFQGSTTATSADQILFYTPAGYSTCWLYALGSTRTWVSGGPTTPVSMSETVLLPGTGVMLQITSTAPPPLLITGSVRTTPFARPLQAGYNLLANPWPLDTTPAQAGMTSTAAFASSNSFATADQLQIWKGDTTPGTSGYLGYWLFQRAAQPNPFWVSNANATLLSQNTLTLLRAGRATFIKAQTKPNRVVWIISPP